MPYTTARGTTIDDNFFEEKENPKREERIERTTAPKDVELSKQDLADDDPRRIRLNTVLQNGQVPQGETIRVLVTRKSQYMRPLDKDGNDIPIEADAIIRDDCTVFKFERKYTEETRKFWIFSSAEELLFYVRRKTFVKYAWVKFCRDRTPVLLKEMDTDSAFPSEPTPLPTGPGKWFWLPQSVIPITQQDFQGTHNFPEFDDEFFYHVNMVSKLVLPVTIDNRACIIIANYCPHWCVTRYNRSDRKIVKAKDNPSYHQLRGSTPTPITIRIPNCPSLPNNILKLTEPIKYCDEISSGMEVTALLGHEDIVQGEYSEVNLVPGASEGCIRFKKTESIDWLEGEVSVPAIAIIASPLPEAVLLASEEWSEYLSVLKPKLIYMRLAGRIAYDAHGYLLFKPFFASLEGTVI